MHAGGSLLGQATDALEVLRVLLVDEVGEISSVVEDHVEGLTIGPRDGLQRTQSNLLMREENFAQKIKE